MRGPWASRNAARTSITIDDPSAPATDGATNGVGALRCESRHRTTASLAVSDTGGRNRVRALVRSDGVDFAVVVRGCVGGGGPHETWCNPMPRPPKYPLEPLLEHRERKVDDATAELGGAVRHREDAEAA